MHSIRCMKSVYMSCSHPKQPQEFRDVNAVTPHIHLCASKMVRLPSLLYPFSVLLIFSSSDQLYCTVRDTAARPIPD